MMPVARFTMAVVVVVVSICLFCSTKMQATLFWDVFTILCIIGAVVWFALFLANVHSAAECPNAYVSSGSFAIPCLKFLYSMTFCFVKRFYQIGYEREKPNLVK